MQRPKVTMLYTQGQNTTLSDKLAQGLLPKPAPHAQCPWLGKRVMMMRASSKQLHAASTHRARRQSLTCAVAALAGGGWVLR